MPLPTPRNNEKRGDFISRCVSNLTGKDEFNDNKQRVAVCMNIFKDAESKASVVFEDGEDTILFFQDAAKAGYGGKKKSYGSPDMNDHYFDSKEKAMKDAEKMGLKGVHTHKTEDGKTLYMAGPNHEAFMKRHKEILKAKGKGG